MQRLVSEVNHGSGSGVVTELGVINGISNGFVSPMLLLERALTIIITTSTHIITIAVIETVAVVALVMVFIVGIIVSVVVLLVVFPAVLVMVAAVVVDVMVLAVLVVAAVVAIAAVVVHTVFDIDPGERVNMSRFFAFECTQETPQSICSKDVAPSNIPCISVTADTSQADKSWLKDCAWWNIPYMRMTADTSHADKSWLKDCAL